VGEPQPAQVHSIQQRMRKLRYGYSLAIAAGLILLIFAGRLGFRAAGFKKSDAARESLLPDSVSKVPVEQGVAVASGPARMTPGWLGIRIQEITPKIASDLHLGSTKGVLIADVDTGGPADSAGLRPQDVLLKYGGQPVSRLREVVRAIAAMRAGTTVRLTVLRENQLLQIDVVAGEGRPDSAANIRTWGDETPGQLGITVENVTPEAQRQMNLLASKGALVIEVKPGEPADEGGVKAGDVIHEFDHVPIESAGELQTITRDLKKESRVFLKVERQRQFVFLEFDLP
jgi:serine protease Do